MMQVLERLITHNFYCLSSPFVTCFSVICVTFALLCWYCSLYFMYSSLSNLCEEKWRKTTKNDNKKMLSSNCHDRYSQAMKPVLAILSLVVS